MTISDKQKEGGEVYHGHDVCMEKSVELLEQNGLPGGLLPLEEVEECGIVRETGFVWILSRKKVEHYFKLAKRKVFYGNEITATISPKNLRSLRGVKAKEMLLWVDVNEIEVGDGGAAGGGGGGGDASGKIHFRGLAGITRTFPVEAFARGE